VANYFRSGGNKANIFCKTSLFVDLVLLAGVCSRFGTQWREGAIVFRGRRLVVDRSTFDVCILAALPSLAVLNLNIWPQLMLS
jgi:hypothetical protein